MKIKIELSLLILYFLLTPFLGKAQLLESKFQQMLDSVYTANADAVGVLIHLESPDANISWTSSVGFSNKVTKEVLSEKQPVLIASNTKPYVSAAILRLVEEGMLRLEDTISESLNKKTSALLREEGYNLQQITIKHLLSHTSGIHDYVNDDYFKFINQYPNYQWSRDKQIKRTVDIGKPQIEPGEAFSYGDINYLLLTEIIEEKTKETFPKAIKKLLKYEELGLNNTWFKGLEPIPLSTLPLAHQYADKYQWDSYELNPSWDLYGGGGIATTVKEAALFFQYLFEGRIIKDKSVLKEMYQYILPKDKSNYCLGIRNISFPTFSAYYHGGWWGTDVVYSPETNSSIAIFTLQKSKRGEFAKLSIDYMKMLANKKNRFKDTIVVPDYELFKASGSKAVLVLFPDGASTAKEIQKEFKILPAAAKSDVSVLMMNFNRHLWIDETKTEQLAEKLESIFIENKLKTENIFIGGMSIGGNVALTLSNYLYQDESSIRPKGVFIIDSPIDLYALYESSVKDVNNPKLSEERLAEPKWIISYFEEEFGTQDNLLKNIQKVSPFTFAAKSISVSKLKNCKLRFYTEPDNLWWKENRQTDFESTNAYAIQQVTNRLKADKWSQLELVETENKGYRSNGERHPHSWSIVDTDELINWIKNGSQQ